MGVDAVWYSALTYVCGAALILVACQFCFEKSIALPCVYFFMCKAFYLNVQTILQYWYIAPDQCFNGAEVPFKLGPRFDLPYYQTISGYGGTIANLLGIALFDRTVQFWRVRPAFWVTTAVNMATTIFELMILERWNQYLFGRDPDVNPSVWADRAFFILGAQAIDKLLLVLDKLPQSVLIGKLCPKGSEAQVFAILASLSSLGNNVAYLSGAIAAQVYGVSFRNSDGVWTCSNPMGPLGVSNLGWLKLTATFVLPGLTIPFTWCLLPDFRLNDDILEEDAGAEGTELQAGLSFEAGPGPAKGQSGVSRSADGALWTAVSKHSLVSGHRGSLLF